MAEVRIGNAEELDAWLKHRPRNWAVAIAARAALRIVPDWAIIFELRGLSNSFDQNKCILSLFRSIALSRLVTIVPNLDLKTAAKAANVAASGINLANGLRDVLNSGRLADAAFAAWFSVLDESYANTVRCATRSAQNSAALWEEIAADARSLLNFGLDSSKGPLWREHGLSKELTSTLPEAEPPLWVHKGLFTLRQNLNGSNNWQVWTDWYEAILNGEPAWRLSHEIGNEIMFTALTWPEEDWSKGPAHVNRRMAEMIEAAQEKDGEPAFPAIPDSKVGPDWKEQPATGLLNPEPRLEPQSKAELAELQLLLPLLRDCVDDLLSTANASHSNSVKRFLPRVENYHVAISREPVSIDEVYAVGLRLRNAHDRLRRDVVEDGFPDIAMEIGEAFDSTIGLHGPLILSTARGKHLDQLARDHNRTKAEELDYKQKAQAFAESVNASSSVVTPSGKTLVVEANEEIADGPFPERSTTNAEAVNNSLLVTLAKKAAAKVVEGLAVDSVKGGVGFLGAVVFAKAGIDPASAFLLANQPVLIGLAASSSESLAWLPHFLRWLSFKVKDAIGSGT